ncbi:hypothetical protein ACOMHN_044362 [Nucella lapillus]
MKADALHAWRKTLHPARKKHWRLRCALTKLKTISLSGVKKTAKLLRATAAYTPTSAQHSRRSEKTVTWGHTSDKMAALAS